MKKNTNGRKNFGMSLKRARLAAGLKKSELARKAELSKTTYQGWEMGQYDPSLIKFQPIIAALGEHARPLLKEIGYAP